MAIDFPASPTNGQIYQGYYYDSSKAAWRSQNSQTGAVITSSTTPTGAKNGDLWFNTIDGTLFVYFNDGISSYWTEIKANSALNTTLDARKANLTGGNTFTGNQTVSGTVDATAFKTNGISAIPTFLQIVNNGALSTNHSFTISQKSNCLFFFSPTGYISAGDGPVATWSLSINSTVRATTKQYFNESGSHRAAPVGMGQTVLDTGSYTANVTTDRRYDSNDFVTIWALLIPTA